MNLLTSDVIVCFDQRQLLRTSHPGLQLLPNRDVCNQVSLNRWSQEHLAVYVRRVLVEVEMAQHLVHGYPWLDARQVLHEALLDLSSQTCLLDHREQSLVDWSVHQQGQLLVRKARNLRPDATEQQAPHIEDQFKVNNDC